MNASTHAKYSTLIDFELTRSALRALSWMISATMAQGDSLDQIASGVGQLLDTQNKALEDIEDAVRQEYKRFDEERATAANVSQADPRDLRRDFIASKVQEGVDAGDIANALNLKKETVEKVIRQLMGTISAEATHERRAGNE